MRRPLPGRPTRLRAVPNFDNIGATSGGGTGIMWMVSLAEFDVFDDDSSITVAELNTIASNRLAVVNDTGDTPLVSADGTLGIVTIDTVNAAGGRHAWWFDELRVGTTLADVTPIPEPSAGLLILFGAATFLRRRQR